MQYIIKNTGKDTVYVGFTDNTRSFQIAPGAVYPATIESDYFKALKIVDLNDVELIKKLTGLGDHTRYIEVNSKFPRVITREELAQQDPNDPWSSPSWSWIDTELATGRAIDHSVPPSCAHKWKDSPGLMRMYRDCEICKAKWEDVYPDAKY